MKRVMAVVFAALFAALAIIEYGNFTGFCYAQSRRLSDADLIQHAIQYNLQKQPKGTGVIEYGSVEAFLARNGNCCVVFRRDRGEFENVLDPIWIRVFGWYVLVVDVWYQFKETGPNNFIQSDVAMNSCGDFIELHTSYGPRPRNAAGNQEFRSGSFASMLACPQHGRLWSNFGRADFPALTVKASG